MHKKNINNKIFFVLFFTLYSFSSFSQMLGEFQSDSIFQATKVKLVETTYEGQIMAEPKHYQEYDTNGHVINAITYSLFDENLPLYKYIYKYDSRGRLISMGSRDLSGQKGIIISPFSGTFNFTYSKLKYDSLGELKKRTHYDSTGKIWKESVYSNNGKVETIRSFDKEGNVRELKVNEFDAPQILSKIESHFFGNDGKEDSSITEIKNFFDETGKLKKSLDPSGRVIEYFYEKSGLLSKIELSGRYTGRKLFRYEYRD